MGMASAESSAVLRGGRAPQLKRTAGKTGKSKLCGSNPADPCHTNSPAHIQHCKPNFDPGTLSGAHLALPIKDWPKICSPVLWPIRVPNASDVCQPQPGLQDKATQFATVSPALRALRLRFCFWHRTLAFHLLICASL